jgi:hypothetical protein
MPAGSDCGKERSEPLAYMLFSLFCNFDNIHSMAASLNINDILSQVKQLDKKDQLTLLQRMADLLKNGEAKMTTSVRLSSISGLGSEIWKSVNSIDKYIDEERQW